MLERARLAFHRFGMPVIAAFLLVLFALSVGDGFSGWAEALATPILALVAMAATALAWAQARASKALERALVTSALAAMAGSALELALTGRFEEGYPYVLGYLPLGYAAAFLFLGPVSGALASLVTYLGGATATWWAVSTGQIHPVLSLPLLAGNPLLIGLLYTLSWSLSATSRAQAAAEESATIDPLTRALNRRSGDAALERLAGRYALLVVDLDDFKCVNDELGHAFGDDVLIRVARALRASVRPHDLVVRWGGDEFVVVAPTTDESAARGIAERVRTGIAALRDERGGPIPATVGLALGEAGEPWHRVFERADAAMYAEKGAPA